MGYRVLLAPGAVRQLDRIPPRFASAIVEFLFGALADNTRRVGKPLRNEFEGLHGARRGDYRVIYRIHDHHVLVIRIDHRASAYRRP
ncbi:MAG: type II toxin-antitoxin system RelE/ParE family toxin [Dermatophilaceae bacterium]